MRLFWNRQQPTFPLQRCIVLLPVMRSRDRDLVKISRRDRDFIKNSETETRDFKICAFCRNFLKNVVIPSDFNFFQISDIFPTCFGCFLPVNTTNNKSLKYRNFHKPFLCNIQSLETWNLRDRDETWNLRDRDETWNLRDWDRDSSRDRDQASRLHQWLLPNNNVTALSK